jgi:hypothetical protein
MGRLRPPQVSARGVPTPVDATAANVPVNDYRQTYAALRADRVESDKASQLTVSRLSSVWGP